MIFRDSKTRYVYVTTPTGIKHNLKTTETDYNLQMRTKLLLRIFVYLNCHAHSGRSKPIHTLLSFEKRMM